MRFGILVVVALLAAPARGEVGPCDKLLESGVRAYLSEATQKSFGRASPAPICAAFERAAEDASGAAAKEVYAAVGGEGEYDRARFEKLKTAYCTLARRVDADGAAYRDAARALNPEAVKAWRRCEDAVSGKYGPPIEVEQIDELTLSVSLKPTLRDLQGVQVTLEGFDWCSGTLYGTQPHGAAAKVKLPDLPRNRDHDLACFRMVQRDAPCGTQAVAPASLRVEFRDGKGGKREHQFRLARVMAQCPVPSLP